MLANQPDWACSGGHQFHYFKFDQNEERKSSRILCCRSEIMGDQVRFDSNKSVVHIRSMQGKFYV